MGQKRLAPPSATKHGRLSIARNAVCVWIYIGKKTATAITMIFIDSPIPHLPNARYGGGSKSAHLQAGICDRQPAHTDIITLRKLLGMGIRPGNSSSPILDVPAQGCRLAGIAQHCLGNIENGVIVAKGGMSEQRCATVAIFRDVVTPDQPCPKRRGIHLVARQRTGIDTSRRVAAR